MHNVEKISTYLVVPARTLFAKHYLRIVEVVGKGFRGFHTVLCIAMSVRFARFGTVFCIAILLLKSPVDRVVL